MRYYKTSIRVIPLTETNTDILAAMLGDIDYESFETLETGINAYIQQPLYCEDCLEQTLTSFPLNDVKISYQTVLLPDHDWNEEWEKKYFQPIVIDNRCTIYSTRHKKVTYSKYNIIINPQLAFGTGTHETTQLLLTQLLDADLRNKSLLDMGCGTSVLAILASMRGANPITAIDIDEWSVKNSIENFRLNHINNIQAFQGDVSALAGLQPFDLVIANINRNILLQDLHAYTAVMHQGSAIWMSGFYTEDIPYIKKEATKCRLNFQYTCELNNWVTTYFIKD